MKNLRSNQGPALPATEAGPGLPQWGALLSSRRFKRKPVNWNKTLENNNDRISSFCKINIGFLQPKEAYCVIRSSRDLSIWVSINLHKYHVTVGQGKTNENRNGLGVLHNEYFKLHCSVLQNATSLIMR